MLVFYESSMEREILSPASLDHLCFKVVKGRTSGALSVNIKSKL